MNIIIFHFCFFFIASPFNILIFACKVPKLEFLIYFDKTEIKTESSLLI